MLSVVDDIVGPLFSWMSVSSNFCDSETMKFAHAHAHTRTRAHARTHTCTHSRGEKLHQYLHTNQEELSSPHGYFLDKSVLRLCFLSFLSFVPFRLSEFRDWDWKKDLLRLTQPVWQNKSKQCTTNSKCEQSAARRDFYLLLQVSLRTRPASTSPLSRILCHLSIGKQLLSASMRCWRSLDNIRNLRPLIVLTALCRAHIKSQDSVRACRASSLKVTSL